MRIAFIVGTFPQLSETFILDQITALIDRGHEVVVFGRAPDENVIAHGVVEQYRLLERARHWEPNARDASSVAHKLEVGGRTLKLLAKQPVRAGRALLRSFNVARYGGLGMGKLWSYASTVLQEPRAFDVILAHFGPNGVMAQRLREVGALRGPLVTVFHGHDVSRLVRQRGDELYRELFAHGELMLPVSEYFRERLITLGCPPEHVKVHRMGVDTSAFELRLRTLGGTLGGALGGALGGDGVVRLISVCRLVEKKGVEFGLRAVAEALSMTDKPFEWHIVGDGPLRAALQAQARELSIESDVTFHGACTRDQVRGLLESAHVFLGPSVTAGDGDQEGVPVSIMEAASSGLPVISTLHSGIAELVQDGVSGFLVPEWDVRAMAACIVRLVEQPELWPAMGASGREIVLRDFDAKKLAVQLEQTLSDVAR